jgi:glyoxylase-like metal-dependent hydrolase (beta-lactamase superfamily II)
MARSPIPGHIPIRLPGVVCHLLHDGQGVTLIDGGLFGLPRRVRRIMQQLGRPPADLKAILQTHGHLDHAGGTARLAKWSSAKVCGHPDDHAHLAGRYPYKGIARICGGMEAFGRLMLRYTPPTVGVELHDGDQLPMWGGLRVMHLPGHTQGHCGFYSERHDVLFSGDLFALHLGMAHRPPVFLNSCPEHFAHSFERVKHLCPKWIVPNHYGPFDDFKTIRKRFDRLCERVLRRAK